MIQTIEIRANLTIEHDITMEILRRLDFNFPPFEKHELKNSNSEISMNINNFMEYYEVIQKFVHGRVLITVDKSSSNLSTQEIPVQNH